jgi:hypothetical protein
MDWYQIYARVQKLESSIQRALASALAAASAAAALAGITRIQAGTATLIGGQLTVATATITANSRIVVSFNTAASGGGANTAKLQVSSASRVVGAPGSFDIQALTIADVLNNTDTSSVDWVVIN